MKYDFQFNYEPATAGKPIGTASIGTRHPEFPDGLFIQYELRTLEDFSRFSRRKDRGKNTAALLDNPENAPEYRDTYESLVALSKRVRAYAGSEDYQLHYGIGFRVSKTQTKNQWGKYHKRTNVYKPCGIMTLRKGDQCHVVYIITDKATGTTEYLNNRLQARAGKEKGKHFYGYFKVNTPECGWWVRPLDDFLKTLFRVQLEEATV